MSRFVLDGTPERVIQRYEELPAQAEAADFGELDRNIVVLDTETTGISVRKDELTQIAAARMDRGQIVDWFVTFVNPGRSIPDDVAHLTNIHDEDVAAAPSPEEALAQLVDFVGDAKVVAHNAAFDRSFTTKHPAGYPLLQNTWIDSLELARITLPRMRSHRLIDLVRAFDAPLSTHRADEDVSATCALYRLLLAGVQAMPVPLVRDISQLAPAEEWPTGTVFAYFAQRAESEGDPAAHEPFSLLDERKAVAKAVGKPKRDAAKMISAELAERSSVRVSGREDANGSGASGAGDADDGGTIIGAGIGQRATSSATSSAIDSDTADSMSGQPIGDSAPIAPIAPIAPAVPTVAAASADPDDGKIAVLEFPTREEIAAAFAPDGAVGRLYEDYQERDQQLQMAQAVRDAFATSDNLVVEAGTGVGKSMAYLVPAAGTALRNNINVGVATKTNALLDQLIYQELPALAKTMAARDGRKLTYAALKGFTHYPCLRKIRRVVRDGARMVNVQGEERTQAPAMAALLSYVQQTDYDDMDSLKIDFRTLPRRTVTTTSHECMRRKCPFYGAPCFVHGQRRRAEAADVVVTNHSLFFCDIAADNGLLPPIRYWVVDEAHGAEAEARRALSLELSVDALDQLADRVSADGTRNLFTRAERNVTGPAAEDGQGNPLPATAQDDFSTLFYGLCTKAKAAGTLFATAEREFADHVRDLLFFDTQKKSSYEFVDLWINDQVRRSTIFEALTGYARTLTDTSEKLVNACQELVAYMEDAQGGATVQREIAAAAFELKDVIAAADAIFMKPTDAYVYAATLARKPERGGNRLKAELYNVGARLDETLYVNTHSAAFASATLTVAGSFKPFEEAMGLNMSPQSHAATLALGSPFDFDANMTIYVPDDLPEPNTPDYLPAMQHLLREAHLAQGGSMLTLFTNRKEMDACYTEVLPALKEADLRLVCQRWGVSVKGLRDDFLADHALSLFALKSFWEGFDAPGSTLRGVMLPKLPFAKPSDPLSCERSARDDAAWRKWVLPQSVLEVKQAVGRLIRKADDRGVVILADRRLLTKGYGRSFLDSMPSRDIRVMPTDQILRELADRREAGEADAGQA